MRVGRDVLASILFLVVAIIGGVGSLELRLGTPGNMGSGYFPLLVSVLLFITAIPLFIKGMADRSLEHSVTLTLQDVRGSGLILLSVLNFAVFIEILGMPATILMSTVIAMNARPDVRISKAIIVGAILAATTWVVFNIGLGLRFPVLPTFIGR